MAVYNFSSGPGVLPDDVIKRAADEMQDWHGSGLSVMEMSHRSPEFISIAKKTEADLRDLMQIPSNYKVLFLQGGATGQFAAIPLNLAGENDVADYVITGTWSKKAYSEASKYIKSHIAADAVEYNHVPSEQEWTLSKGAKYVHVTPNETIEGVAFDFVPATGDIPLVADMSSVILSELIDVSKYGVIYAGAQKNIGIAGVTLVIVREDLLGNAHRTTPSIWNWQAKAKAGSMVNTPPCYNWYLCGLVFEWLKEHGGITEIAKQNAQKAKLLYEAIDSSDLYNNNVAVANRSKMNVPFTLNKPGLDQEFLVQAKQAGLITLQGHRSVGGMRASIYNAMPIEGVDALVRFMNKFEEQNG